MSFADVLGSGTTAIVISRMAPVVEHWYCGLCETATATAAADGRPPAVKRPNLLAGADNNLGAASTATYASSTRFLLADKRAGRPWPGRLPGPVQVLIQTVARDLVGGSEITTSYHYHDGHYDAFFRRFGASAWWSVRSRRARRVLPADADQELVPHWRLRRVGRAARPPPRPVLPW